MYVMMIFFAEFLTKIRSESNIPIHTVEKGKIFSNRKKKIRQINYLAISLVEPLLSRNFCQKSVRVVNL